MAHSPLPESAAEPQAGSYGIVGLVPHPAASQPGNPRRALEALLEHVTGVLAARVETTPDGEVSQVHVVTDGTLPPSLQRRQIRSALLAAHDVDLEPELITLVPLRERFDEVPEPGNSPGPDLRVRLNHIAFEQEGLQIVAQVEVLWRGRTFYGVSRDADTASGRILASARGALKALECVTEGRAAFQLEALDPLRASDRRITVASVHAVSDGERVELVGCARVGMDANYGAAQAVLAAVNRWLVRPIAGARPAGDEGQGDREPARVSVGKAPAQQHAAHDSD